MKDLSLKRKTACGVIIALIIFTLAFIWVNSCLPKSASAEESSAVTSAFQNFLNSVFGEGTIILSENFIRKAAHFTEFFALGAEIAALTVVLKRESFLSYLFVLPAGLIAAAIDEGIQLLSGRGAEVKDVLIDYSGYFAAILIFFLIYSVRRAVKSKR